MVGLAVSAGFGAVAITGPVLTTQLLAKTDSANAPVTAVVRNELGQLKWVATEATGYSPLEAEGRQAICARAARTIPVRSTGPTSQCRDPMSDRTEVGL